MNWEILFLSPPTFQASLDDSADCLKSYVCQSSALPADDPRLGDLEAAVRARFAATLPELDTSSGAVEFHLASVVGAAHGAAHCRAVYARCPAEFGQLADALRQTAAGAQINWI